MEGRIDVAEEVPDVADDDAHDLVLGHVAVQDEAEAHQHPGQVGGGEDEQAEEAEPRVRVAPRPDVHQGGGERVAEEGHGDQRREQDEAAGGVHEQPGEVRGGPAGGFFQEPGVALEEVDVEEQVEREGTEIEERG